MILYKTVTNEASAEQIIEKSKFIVHVKPVNTREEAEEFIRKIKSEFKDATHNVPAMVIGDKFQIQWASDDGEPNGTSGAPIVQMLVKEGITNVAIVVTRYFGGIKLGTGGLVRAYTGSAKLGIEVAGLSHVKEVAVLDFKIEYSFLQPIQNLAKNVGFRIGDIFYEEKITISCLTEPEFIANIIEQVASVTNGRAQLIAERYEVAKVPV